MSKKKRKYGETGFRAEFSEVNNLGIREYETRTFNDEEKTEAKNRKAADTWLDECEAVWNEKGTLDNEQTTFAAYVGELEKTHLCEAEIKNGKKIAGLKGWNRVGKYHLQMLMKIFAKAKVRDIKEREIEAFRIKRRRQVSVAAVNRELALLRKILHLAYRHQIISRKPVFDISLADENERNRILAG